MKRRKEIANLFPVLSKKDETDLDLVQNDKEEK